MSKKKTENQQFAPATPPCRKKVRWWMIAAVVLVAAVLTVVLWPGKISTEVSDMLAVWLWPGKISTEVSDELDACIVSTLRSVHYSNHTDTKYPVVAYTPLSVEQKGNTTTVYGVMMYREYTCTIGGELRQWASANEAFVLTAEKTAKGYKAVDCWWPESGAEYVYSIMDKFPRRVREDAVNAQQYVSAHEAACEAEVKRNVAAADKYMVLESEAKNLRLAYCANTKGAYIIFGAGYNTDGTYTAEDGKAVFTFGKCTLTFKVKENTLVYDAAASVNVPNEWQTIGENEYLTDGAVFAPEGDAPSTPEKPKHTAPVGATVTVTNQNWMSETDLREMFGQYVPSTYFETENPKYLPVRPIESREQLDRFIATYADGWTDLKAENFAQFDEAFFKNNYLLLTYYRDGMAASEPKVSEYVYVQDGTSLWLSVRLEVTQPAEGDTVVGQWLLFSGIAKEDYKKATGLEAYVEKTITKTNADSVSDFTLTGIVKEVDGRAMLLECVGDSQFATVWVELGNAELDPMVGETYIVTYEDFVMPSLPPRITAVTITKN